MTTHNPVEVTGNIIVHHPAVKDSADLPATTIIPVVSPESWTPAPAPCRYCRRVHQPVYVGQAAS